MLGAGIFLPGCGLSVIDRREDDGSSGFRDSDRRGYGRNSSQHPAETHLHRNDTTGRDTNRAAVRTHSQAAQGRFTVRLPRNYGYLPPLRFTTTGLKTSR